MSEIMKKINAFRNQIPSSVAIFLLGLLFFGGFFVSYAGEGAQYVSHIARQSGREIVSLGNLFGERVPVTVTGYSSTIDQTDDTPFITAANTYVRDGIVAANFLPLYTEIQIPELFGDKVFVVEDRMNRRYQDRVDVWFPTRWQARSFGKQEVEIIVLGTMGETLSRLMGPSFLN